MTILLVDDNEMNLYQLEVLLGGNGYSVVTAANGAEALVRARQNPPDLIVSDILMPVMDGFTLCREWIQDERLRSIPFVFYTATYTDDRDREFALSLGAAQFLVKPEEPEVFLQTILDVLRQVPESVSPVVEATSSPPEEACYLKQYNETLIRKLEQKMSELEETNRVLKQEIVERRHAEDVLRESEERYRTLFECAGDAIFIHDEQARTLAVNSQACEWLGYPYAELMTLKIDQIDSPEEARYAKERISRVMERGHLTFETVHRRKDGSFIPTEVSAQRITWGGQPAVMSICRDLAERKRAEGKLQAISSELELIFKNMINAFVIWESVFDESGKYVSFRFGKFNDAYARISKLKYEEVQGKDVFEVWPATEQSWVDVYGGVAVTGIPVTFEMYHEPTKGWYYCNVYRPSDSPMQICVIFEDITERKQAEEEREKLQIQLNQAQKMESVGRLAGGVAHDFNNMLGVILGHTEIAMEQVDPADPIFADLEQIRKAANRSTDLTRQLLAFARKQTAAPRVLNLNATVESMLKMLQRLIGEDIDLKWLPAADLWPVKMDPSQIDQILANLCVNARDAVADVGEIVIETGNSAFDEEYCVGHMGVEQGEYVRISVSDNGCGMDTEILGHVFEPFFTTKEIGQGTGLGLATVYGIVRQNDGFINIYSEPGIGSTFSIYLPRYGGEIERGGKEAPEKSVSSGNETILLVEDEPAILNMTAMILKRLGYTVLAASAPGEAIRLAQEHSDQIHLLMTDVVMPEMNGRDLARRLLSLYPGLKCLFMSGYTADVIAHHGVLEDGVQFIQKPFTLKDLSAKIREVFEQD
jgi:PAS domain S-box-containing protein